jgi:hypothetical protein
VLIFIVRTASHFAEAMRLAGADLIASAGNASYLHPPRRWRAGGS